MGLCLFGSGKERDCTCQPYVSQKPWHSGAFSKQTLDYVYDYHPNDGHKLTNPHAACTAAHFDCHKKASTRCQPWHRLPLLPQGLPSSKHSQQWTETWNLLGRTASTHTATISISSHSVVNHVEVNTVSNIAPKPLTSARVLANGQSEKLRRSLQQQLTVLPRASQRY